MPEKNKEEEDSMRLDRHITILSGLAGRVGFGFQTI